MDRSCDAYARVRAATFAEKDVFYRFVIIRVGADFVVVVVASLPHLLGFLKELGPQLRELLLVEHGALADALLVFRLVLGRGLSILALHHAPLHALLEPLQLRHDRLLVSRDGLAALFQAPVELLLRTTHVRALRLAQKRGFLRGGGRKGAGARQMMTHTTGRGDRDPRRRALVVGFAPAPVGKPCGPAPPSPP